jgi:hypothetical protein
MCLLFQRLAEMKEKFEMIAMKGRVSWVEY